MERLRTLCGTGQSLAALVSVPTLSRASWGSKGCAREERQRAQRGTYGIGMSITPRPSPESMSLCTCRDFRARPHHLRTRARRHEDPRRRSHAYARARSHACTRLASARLDARGRCGRVFAEHVQAVTVKPGEAHVHRSLRACMQCARVRVRARMRACARA